MRESHQLLSAVTEGTSDVLFVKDDAGRYLMINRAGRRRGSGRAPEDCIGAGVRELFAAASADRILADDAAVMAAGETREFEQALAPLGGERRLFLVTESPYRDADGRIVGVVGVGARRHRPQAQRGAAAGPRHRRSGCSAAR